MNFLSNPIVARLLWALPLLMFVISGALLRAGLGQKNAADYGEVIEAHIDSLDVRERSEITHAAVYLTYTLPDGTHVESRKVEMQLVFIKQLEGREGETIQIRVDVESGQIVQNEHRRAQWVLTFSFAAMALIGALGLSWMVAGWNRFLKREGDPGERVMEKG
ncbi:MAG: hypothetical protein IIB09_04270 [Bacteroidetes bacterium]|nr:hypothetical protein [Bacteroidota bacterium]